MSRARHFRRKCPLLPARDVKNTHQIYPFCRCFPLQINVFQKRVLFGCALAEPLCRSRGWGCLALQHTRQDRATAALTSARKLYGMSAADLERKPGSGSSRRGRGRFAAVEHVASSDGRGLSPERPLDDLISFGDASGGRLGSPYSAPASSVGSSVSV